MKTEFGTTYSLLDEGNWDSIWIDCDKGDTSVNLTTQDLLVMLADLHLSSVSKLTMSEETPNVD